MSDRPAKNEYDIESRVESRDWEDHDSRHDCPRSPEEIALLFDRVRNDSPEFRSESEQEIAQEVLSAIGERLSSKYGHERPIDWHDHPEAALLAIGESAARRIAEYEERRGQEGINVETNERVRDWNQALTAFAFSLYVEQGNALWKAIREHGDYDSKPIFGPGEYGE